MMTILRSSEKIIWKRKNNFVQDFEIVLYAGIEQEQLYLMNQSNEFNAPIALDKDQFLEMVAAGAAYFGKKVCFEEASDPCPYCGGTTFEFEGESDGRVRKVCQTCGLTGPYADDINAAEHAWEMLFTPPQNPNPYSVTTTLLQKGCNND